MAGRRKHQLPPNDATLTGSFWRRFSDVDEPTVRNKLLYLAMDDVGVKGAAEFNGIRVCERLGVSASLINHYFGGRDGLIAEATAMAYIAYVKSLRAAAATHSDARKSLRAWMVQQVEWAKANPGFAEILNYASAHGDISRLVQRDFRREITAYFEFNMSLLVSMIQAIRNGTQTDLLDSPDDVARVKPEVDPDVLADAGSVAWSTLGAAVWASGQHMPSAETEDARRLFALTLERHFDRIVNSISQPAAV